MTFRQELVALFGRPVDENPTQVMVEAAFRRHGLDWRYLTIEVAPEDLGTAVAGARAMGFRGFHCTLPHKVAVVEHLDRLGESAALIGAVNTVVARDGELVGENTDGRGFLAALQRRVDPPGLRAVVLGAGGAARAIAVELALAGVAEIGVANRTEERGRELSGLVAGLGVAARFIPWEGELAVPPRTDVLVNATSIGLHPDVEARVPVARESLRPGLIVADVIPNPPRTRFLCEAADAGCETVDGLEMLVAQGALSVEYWTGVTPDQAVMREALAAIFA
ncbi:MAG TPA: shikimate dehydrogenase [Gaiellaceae bacterium]|nr:shikimate dehydrogenase [Gaiellaceae bacterium]